MNDFFDLTIIITHRIRGPDRAAYKLVAWRSGSVVRRMNEVTPRSRTIRIQKV